MIELKETIEIICFISYLIIGFNTTIVFILDKWGFFDWYEYKLSPRLVGILSFMPDNICIFCLFGFWLSMIEVFFIHYYLYPSYYIFIIPLVVASFIMSLVKILNK